MQAMPGVKLNAVIDRYSATPVNVTAGKTIFVKGVQLPSLLALQQKVCIRTPISVFRDMKTIGHRSAPRAQRHFRTSLCSLCPLWLFIRLNTAVSRRNAEL